MKTGIQIFLALFCSFGFLLYLCGSFVVLSFDISKWEPLARFGLVGFDIIASLVLTGFIIESRSEICH